MEPMERPIIDEMFVLVSILTVTAKLICGGGSLIVGGFYDWARR